MDRIYLDNAATTPVAPEVLEAMLPYFNSKFGNPSSTHSFGQETKKAVEEARQRIADLIKARADEIVFTSGGSEADNFAIKGAYFTNEERGNHIITSVIDHHAVFETCKYLEGSGASITYLPVDNFGKVNLKDVQNAITDKTVLISIMHASNEFGTVQPIDEIGKFARNKGICFHTDAVQSTGHISVDVDKLGVDLMAMSAHKLCGPKGIGALYIRNGTKLVQLIHGGEQERGRRATTENVHGIVGFGMAAELARNELDDEVTRTILLRKKLINGLFDRIGNVTLNGHPADRLPNNVNVSFEFVDGGSIVIALDAAGIAASTGSACASSEAEPSHALMAIGISKEQARGSVRFSLGRDTKESDIDRLLEVLPPIVSRLRGILPL